MAVPTATANGANASSIVDIARTPSRRSRRGSGRTAAVSSTTWLSTLISFLLDEPRRAATEAEWTNKDSRGNLPGTFPGGREWQEIGEGRPKVMGGRRLSVDQRRLVRVEVGPVEVAA